jgi:prepilin signal peptidase PulO-like enzyme (type II secretory pathway)
MSFLIGLFVFIFGASIGSFLNVVILRLPDGKTLNGFSHCPNCNHRLGFFDLFPILSFVFLLGKCRYCKKTISRRYFYIELITALLTLITYLIFPFYNFYTLIYFLRALLVLYVLISVFIIDYEHFIILDNIILFGSVSVAVCSFVLDLVSSTMFTWRSSLIVGLLSGLGLAIFFYIQYLLSKGRWIGLGDVKFALFLGLATPFPFIIATILLAYFIGAFTGIVLIVGKGAKLKSELPFGTFLSVACLLALYYGYPLMQWYFRMIGLKYGFGV